MSTRDIEAYLRELYGVSVGRDLISRVTDAVMDDVREWQHDRWRTSTPSVSRRMVVKVRDGGTVQRHACYLALAITIDGQREVLGMWFQETEGAKFWMQVLADLETARRPGHPDLLRGRAPRLPRGDRGCLPPDRGADVHRASDPTQPEVRAPPQVRQGGQGPTSRSTPPVDADAAQAALEALRSEVGPAAPGGQGLAERLGARHPVHGLPAGRPPGDLHHKSRSKR